MIAESSESPYFFCAGVITSAHGVRGHVKVKCFLEDPRQLRAYSPFSNEKGEEVYKINKILSQDEDILIVSLEDITDRNQAELLKRSKLMVPCERLPKLSDDTYYHSELIGLSVVSQEGQLLGKVQALYNFGAGELLEIKTLKESLQMLPFTHEIIPEVDLKEGRIFLSIEGEIFLKGESDVS